MKTQTIIGLAVLALSVTLAVSIPPPPPWQRPADWDKTAANVETLETYRCPIPDRFASVFSFGYAEDHFPADPAKFEAFLGKLKAAGFNVVHTAYRPDRPAACGKAGMKLMIDLLYGPQHVYQNPAGLAAVCKAVEGDTRVWGYNIWNSRLEGHVGAGRRRNLNSVRRLDPSHPSYVGTWGDIGLASIPNVDVFGYYDLAWGKPEVLEKHFVHLSAALAHARKTNSVFYSWLGVPSGEPGEQNFRRCLWSANTGLAMGLKGAMWFLGTNMMDEKTLEWKPAGKDIARVNEQIVAVGHELVYGLNPTAVYSTPVTKKPGGEALPGGLASRMPPGLEQAAFPKDFWLQPVSGEFLVGVFDDRAGHDMVYIVNHSAVAAQTIRLKISRPVKDTLSRFDRAKGTWNFFFIADNSRDLDLQLGAGEGCLLRFERAKK